MSFRLKSNCDPYRHKSVENATKNAAKAAHTAIFAAKTTRCSGLERVGESVICFVDRQAGAVELLSRIDEAVPDQFGKLRGDDAGVVLPIGVMDIQTPFLAKALAVEHGAHRLKLWSAAGQQRDQHNSKY